VLLVSAVRGAPVGVDVSLHMSEIDRYIEELRDTVRVAWLNYEIWWVYKSTDTRPEYVDTMNRYPLFFQTSIHAHFVALLVALYRLYETRDDTYNIPTLLKLLSCTVSAIVVPSRGVHRNRGGARWVAAWNRDSNAMPRR